MGCLQNYCKFVLVLFGIFGLVAATPVWYTASDGNRYLIERNAQFNWLQAYDKCANSDLQLAVIDSGPKNDAFVALLQSISAISDSLWLGLQDQFNTEVNKNRSFYSVATGEQVYFSNWKTGEPNNQGGTEHCVSVYTSKSYAWNDARCNSNYLGYVCEENYQTTIYDKDMAQRRQAMREINFQISSNFANTQDLLRNITQFNREEFDLAVKTWRETVNNIVGDAQNSIEEIQQAVMKVTESLHGLIDDSFKQFEVASNVTLSEFATNLRSDQNDLNNIMVY